MADERMPEWVDFEAPKLRRLDASDDDTAEGQHESHHAVNATVRDAAVRQSYFGNVMVDTAIGQHSINDGSDPTEPQIAYVGCYTDDASRDLPHYKGDDKDASSCSQMCRNYDYFALQYNGQCFCGNGYNTTTAYTRKDDSECGLDLKGRQWRNAVFTHTYVDSDLTVYGHENFAQATLSSTYADMDASRCVDGDLNTYCQSGFDDRAWLRFELESAVTVVKVMVANRRDSHQDRLGRFNVMLKTSSGWEECRRGVPTDTSTQWQHVYCLQPMEATEIQIQFAEEHAMSYLHIADVKVLGAQLAEEAEEGSHPLRRRQIRPHRKGPGSPFFNAGYWTDVAIQEAYNLATCQWRRFRRFREKHPVEAVFVEVAAAIILIEALPEVVGVTAVAEGAEEVFEVLDEVASKLPTASSSSAGDLLGDALSSIGIGRRLSKEDLKTGDEALLNDLLLARKRLQNVFTGQDAHDNLISGIEALLEEAPTRHDLLRTEFAAFDELMGRIGVELDDEMMELFTVYFEAFDDLLETDVEAAASCMESGCTLAMIDALSHGVSLEAPEAVPSGEGDGFASALPNLEVESAEDTITETRRAERIVESESSTETDASTPTYFFTTDKDGFVRLTSVEDASSDDQ